MTEAQKMPYIATTLVASRILAFAPHPDDEIFGCGGALALLCDNNAKALIQVCTDGSLGGIQQGEIGLVEGRKIESNRALESLQINGRASLNFWDFADRSLAQEPTLTEAIRSAVSGFKPDLVFAPSLMEVHPDHLAVAIAVFECWQTATIGQSFELCMYEIGRPVETNCLVDISSVSDRKRRAMECFKSQLAERDYLHVIEGLNRYRSYTLGNHVAAAEAFFRLPKAAPLLSGRSVGSFSHLSKLLPPSMRAVLHDLDATIA